MCCDDPGEDGDLIYPSHLEISYKYCFNLLNIGDMVMPHYWSNLFLALRSILNDDQMTELKKMVTDVTFMCGTKTNKKEVNGEIQVEVIPLMSLYEIETYLFNSWNLKSYFLVNGQKISQFEIEKKLFDIKQWCYYRLFEIQSQILFTKPPIRL